MPQVEPLNILILLPGENMAGARPAIASCRFLAKSEILQTNTPSKVVADISLSRPSISTTVRSFSPTVLSNCRTCRANIWFYTCVERQKPVWSNQINLQRSNLGDIWGYLWQNYKFYLSFSFVSQVSVNFSKIIVLLSNYITCWGWLWATSTPNFC